MIRASPLWKFENLLDILDSKLQTILSKLLNVNFDCNSWTQATLPVRWGGLGIRQISSVALPAFLASSYSVRDLFNGILYKTNVNIEVTHLEEAKNAWYMACPNQNFPVTLSSQRQWDEPLCNKVYDDLLNGSTDTAERARLIAVRERESGLWLHAFPSRNIGSLLDRTTLSVSSSLRLGTTINVPHRCRCGDAVGRLGHHGLSCMRSAGRLSRHAGLNDIIRRALSSLNVPSVLEPSGIFRDDGKRPDGMTLLPWKQGRPLVWDATCVDTLAASHLQGTSASAGAAATTAEHFKRRKYSGLSNDYYFVPFGVETLGPWGPEARQFVKELSSRLAEVSGDRRAGTYLGQRISLMIQRGNVASILGTLPPDSDMGDFFYL